MAVTDSKTDTKYWLGLCPCLCKDIGPVNDAHSPVRSKPWLMTFLFLPICFYSLAHSNYACTNASISTSYSGADKSLARPGRKKATATKDIDCHISYLESQKLVPGAFPGGKGGRCVSLTNLPPSCAVVMKSRNLNFLEPSRPLQACNGTAAAFKCVLYVRLKFPCLHREGK